MSINCPTCPPTIRKKLLVGERHLYHSSCLWQFILARAAYNLVRLPNLLAVTA